jgi:hypothetical protein
VLVGHDTRLVLAEAGFPPAEIESLLAAKVVADVVLRDIPADEPWGPPAPPAARQSWTAGSGMRNSIRLPTGSAT